MFSDRIITLNADGHLTGQLDDFQPVTLEGKRIKSVALKVLKKHGGSEASARKYLISVGMLTPTGRRKRIYSGPSRSKKSST